MQEGAQGRVVVVEGVVDIVGGDHGGQRQVATGEGQAGQRQEQAIRLQTRRVKGAQRAALVEKRGELDASIALIDRMLDALKGGITMADTEKFEGLKRAAIARNERKDER